MDYRADNPIDSTDDFSDLFYIDQRRTAWGSANRMAEDCFDFDWIVFSNSWRIYDIMLSMKTEQRRVNSVSLIAMNYLAPNISKDFPINTLSFKTRIKYIVKFLVPDYLISKLV